MGLLVRGICSVILLFASAVIIFLMNAMFFKWNVIPDDSHFTNEVISTEGYQWSFIKVNGVNLNVAEVGVSGGPLVILLHGFPHTGLLAWHKQVPMLKREGYHVVIPDMRGYNTSDKPEGIESYDVAVLAKDVVGLVDHFKQEKAMLVAHDWGSIVAWEVARAYPERVDRLVIMAAPNAKAYQDNISFSQLRKSWYILFFQFPWLPEIKLTSDGNAALASLLANSGSPGITFSKDSMQRQQQAWNEPGAVHSMLNYYRAMFIGPSAASRRAAISADPYIKVKTLLIWGKKDLALDPAMGPGSLRYCTAEGSRLLELDVSHWIQLDAGEQVGLEIIKFFKE